MRFRELPLQKIDSFFSRNQKGNLTHSNSIKFNIMSSVASTGAIRIVSLPAELKTTYDVADFITSNMPIGFVSYVTIKEARTESGVPYRTAVADVGEWPEEADFSGGKQISSDCVPGGLHFDNGKPMNFVKVVSSKSPSPSMESLELIEGAWTDLFIPVVPENLTMDKGDVRLNEGDVLADFFECCLQLGKVRDVEFSNVPGKPYRSAIVRIVEWYNNPTSKTLRHVVDGKGDYVCKGFYDGFEFVRFDRGQFIALRKYKQETSSAELSKRVAELEKELAELRITKQ